MSECPLRIQFAAVDHRYGKKKTGETEESRDTTLLHSPSPVTLVILVKWQLHQEIQVTPVSLFTEKYISNIPKPSPYFLPIGPGELLSPSAEVLGSLLDRDFRIT